MKTFSPLIALLPFIAACSDNTGQTAAAPLETSEAVEEVSASSSQRSCAAIERAAADFVSPLPDFDGFRLHMRASDAIGLVRCRFPDARVEQGEMFIGRREGLPRSVTVATATVGVPCSSRDQMMTTSTTRNTARCHSLARGLDGYQNIERQYVFLQNSDREDATIWGVYRREDFSAGGQPALSGILSALSSKYGEPLYPDSGRSLYQASPGWAWNSQDGQRSPRSRNANECVENISAFFGDGLRWSPDCGAVFKVGLYGAQENEGLAQRIQVAFVDQGGGDRSLRDAVAAQEAVEEERRRRELDEAQENATTF